MALLQALNYGTDCMYSMQGGRRVCEESAHIRRHFLAIDMDLPREIRFYG